MIYKRFSLVVTPLKSIIIKHLSLMLLLFFCINTSQSQQLPDTLHYLHNSGVSGTQWAFTVVQITDIHLGESSPNNDYGTAGWNDTIDQNTNCPATEILRNTVHWINNNIVAENIAFVLVTGDISDRGEKSGFIMARRILDSLNVPYVVTNGNHDMWPRVSGNEAPMPFGDSVFAQVFASNFLLNTQQFSQWNNGTRLNRVYNPLNDMYSQFQNFSFAYGSYRFIINDFATRDKKPIGVGTMTDAALFDFTGGSYPWLSNAMSQAQAQIPKGIILVQHFPPDNELLSSTYSFSSSEYDSLIDIIEPHAANFGLCVAGHRHRNKTYNIKRSAFAPVLGVGIETDANYKYPNGMLRLIKFWDYPSTFIRKHRISESNLFPNPATNNTLLVFNKDICCKPLDVEILNTAGVKIRTYFNIVSHTLEIDATALPQGLYFVRISGNNYFEVLKMLVLN